MEPPALSNAYMPAVSLEVGLNCSRSAHADPPGWPPDTAGTDPPSVFRFPSALL